VPVHVGTTGLQSIDTFSKNKAEIIKFIEIEQVEIA
jgi:hypothetical protein